MKLQGNHDTADYNETVRMKFYEVMLVAFLITCVTILTNKSLLSVRVGFLKEIS